MKLNGAQFTKSTGALTLGLFLLAAYLRFSQLIQIPPGLHPLEANLGLKSLSSGWSHLGGIQSLLAVWAVKLSSLWIHDKVLALRFPAAAASLVGLGFFWLWLKHLFGRRVALIGTALAATTPWVLNLSRFGAGYSLALAFMAISLYFLAKAWEKPSVSHISFAFLVTALGLYADPVYNWYVFGLLLIGLAASPLIIRQYRKGKLPQLSIGGLMLLLIAAPAAPAVVGSALATATTLPRHFLSGLGDVLTMFWLKSPAGFDFNLSALPLLNVFLALMLLLGILATLTRLRPKNHRFVLSLLLVALIAAVTLAGKNDLGAQTLLLVWPTFALIALGTEYLLSQWLRTFPQNNAARQLGGVMLLILILLSAREGYNQYFLAWPASSGTKEAYHQSTLKADTYLMSQKFSGQRFFVGTTNDLPIVKYLGLPTQTQTLTVTDLGKLPKDKTPHQFVLMPAVKDAAFKSLAKQFPGGKLEAKLDHNGAEDFLIYNYQP